MFSFPEQLTLASKAWFEAQLASATAFAQAAFDGGTTLMALNFDAARTSLSALSSTGKQLIAVKDANELSSLATAHSQQAMERLRQYGAQALDLAHNSRAKFTAVAENEGAVSQRKTAELVDAVKQVPTDAVVPLNTFLQTALDHARRGADRQTQPAV